MSYEDLRIITAEVDDRKKFVPVESMDYIKSIWQKISDYGLASIQHFANINSQHSLFNKIDKTQDDLYDLDDSRIPISKFNTVEEIENFLTNQQLDNNADIPVYMISSQVSIICSSRVQNLGLRLLFATYIKSLSFIAEFLCNSPPVDAKTNKKLAQQAIEMLMKSQLPPLFYPDFSKGHILSIDISDYHPLTPTSIATSETALYVVSEGPTISIIPIQKSSEMEVPSYPIQGISNEPISVVCQNGSIFFFSQSIQACNYDIKTQTIFPIPVSYRGNLFKKLNSLSPPVISDGNYLYSVDFGNKPAVKVFKLEMDAVLFVKVIKLIPGDNKLNEYFPELLPIQFKDTSAMASNGIYISFILHNDEVTVCRIFLLRNGRHLHDVIIGGENSIWAWTFDIDRPAHCVVSGTVAYMLESCFTLPMWLTGFMEPPEKPTVSDSSNKAVMQGYCDALANVAAQCIGAEAWLPFHLSDQCYRTTMETAVAHFIKTRNRSAAQAYLVFLAIKMRQEPESSAETRGLLTTFLHCFGDREFEYLRTLIVYVLLSALDSFCEADRVQTSELLLRIIESNQYNNVLFKFLPKSKYVTRALTDKSLKALCDLVLETKYEILELSITLLKELQYGFITAEKGENLLGLFSIYLKELTSQFLADFEELKGERWSAPRFTSTPSFVVFEELVKTVRAAAEIIHYDFSVVDVFFEIGCLEIKEKEETAAIKGLFTQSLYLAILLGLNLVRKDISFIGFGQRNKPQDNYEDFIKGLNIATDSIPQEIINSIVETIYFTNRSNVTQKEIEDGINKVFANYIQGKITELQIRERASYLENIPRQLFRTVIMFLNGEADPLLYTEMDECPSVRFLKMFERDFLKDKERRVAFSMFIPQIHELWESFSILPTEMINDFLKNCDLRYYMPSGLFKCSTFEFELNSLPMQIDQLEGMMPTLIEIAPKLKIGRALEDEFKNYNPTSVFLSLERDELIRVLCIGRLLARKSSQLPSIDKTEGGKLSQSFLNFSQNIISLGSVQITQLLFDIYADLYENGFEDTMFVDECITAIEEFICLRKVYLIEENDHLSQLQDIQHMAVFIRKTLNKGYKASIKAIAKAVDEKKAAVMMICNGEYEIPRPSVSVVANVALHTYSGNVLEYNGNGLKLEDELGRPHSLAYTNARTAIAEPTPFESSVLKDFYPKIIEYFDTFHSQVQFHRFLWDNSLLSFCRDPEFISMITPSLIEKVIDNINIHYVSSRNIDLNIASVFVMEFGPHPNFSLYAEQDYNPQKQIPIVLNEGPSKITTTSHVIISLGEPKQYLSMPIHKRMPARVDMAITSHGAPTSIRFFMVGNNPNARFTTSMISSRKKFEIEIAPESNSIKVQSDVQQQDFLIPNSTELIFSEVNLGSSTIVNYTFNTRYEFIDSVEHSNGAEPQYLRSKLDKFPHEISVQFIWGLMESLMKEHSANYGLKIGRLIASNASFGSVPLQKLAEIVILSLSIADSFPTSKNLTMSISNPEIEEFASSAFRYVLDNNLSTEFLDILQNIVNTQTEEIKDRLYAPWAQSVSHFTHPIDDITGIVFDKGTIDSKIHQKVNQMDYLVTQEGSTNGTIISLMILFRQTIIASMRTSKTLKQFREFLSKISGLLGVTEFPSIKEIFDCVLPPEHTVLSQTEEWSLNALSELYEDNKVFTEIVDQQFFIFRGSPLCFPIFAFIPRILVSTSFISSIVAMNQKMISFQNYPSSDHEYIFLYITSTTKSEETTEFEVSSEPTFKKVLHTISLGSFAILPPFSFYVRPKNPRFDIKKAQFYWKTLSYTGTQVKAMISEQINKWSPLHSQILMLSMENEETLTAEEFSCIPLSARFSYDTAAFFFASLKRCGDCPEIAPHTHRDVRLPSLMQRRSAYSGVYPRRKLSRLVPSNLDSNELCCAIAALAYCYDDPSFTIPISAFRKCHTNRGLAAFASIAGTSQQLPMPFYLRRTIYSLAVEPEVFISRSNFDPTIEKITTTVLKRLKPYIISVILEAATGHCSLASLDSDPNPSIAFRVNSDSGVRYEPRTHLVSVYPFEDEQSLLKAMMESTMEFIESQ